VRLYFRFPLTLRLVEEIISDHNPNLVSLLSVPSTATARLASVLVADVGGYSRLKGVRKGRGLPEGCIRRRETARPITFNVNDRFRPT
jgi:hypothetical protein